MLIVLDTNVLVAELLTPFGPCGEIVRLVSSGEVTLALDARILSEYREVLARKKFGFDPRPVAIFLEFFESQGVKVAAARLSDRLPDTNDEPFLEVALAARASCIVTGNGAHFPAKHCEGMLVQSPRKFIDARSGPPHAAIT